MKAYMGYSRIAGSSEGACLVFATNAKEARKLAWRRCQFDLFEEWVEVAVKWIRDLPEHLKALDMGKPQCLLDVPSCQRCETWGGHPCEDGRCDNCESDDNY